MAPPFPYQFPRSPNAWPDLNLDRGTMPNHLGLEWGRPMNLLMGDVEPRSYRPRAYDDSAPARRPRALEVYPSVKRSGSGGQRLSEVLADAGSSAEASSPEIPQPKLRGGGQGRGGASYGGSYKGNIPGTSYEVGKGETLGQIARNFGLSVKDIMQANPQIRDPNRIMAGAALNIPVSTRHMSAPFFQPPELYGPDIPATSQFRTELSSPAASPRFDATADMRGEGYRLGQSIRDQIGGMFGPTVEPMEGNPNYGRRGRELIR